MERKEVPRGIIACIIFIVALDVFYLSSLGYHLMVGKEYLPAFLSMSILSFIRWIEAILAVLSLVIIPYGFLRRNNGARTYAFVFLAWSALEAIATMALAGEKTIRFPLLVLSILLITYLLMSSVKQYFRRTATTVIPSKTTDEYTYGDYTLYSRRVRLKNKKTQVIYYFSKHKPRSGTPARFPAGFEVRTSKRSGLPYLKRNDSSTMIGIT